MEKLIPILIPSLFAVALVLERLFPAKPLPRIKGWLPKGLVFFLITGVVNTALPAGVAALVGEHAPLDLSGLGIVLGALVAFAVSDFFAYWFHRTVHRIGWLWRWTHQMHHSAERMDLAGMSYNHPFDMLLAFGLPGLVVALLGVSSDAAALAGFLGFLTAVVQHANIRTPRLLGYIIQRPESHGLHHERGVHAYNYATLPFWDMLFGTFRNPAHFPAAYGFWDGASARLGAMLIGRDVGERR